MVENVSFQTKAENRRRDSADMTCGTAVRSRCRQRWPITTVYNWQSVVSDWCSAAQPLLSKQTLNTNFARHSFSYSASTMSNRL